jgi:coatomer subunit beta'
MLDQLNGASRIVEESQETTRSLELRETVMMGAMIPDTANSVYKLQRQLFARSERVKGIDFHPVEPWILTTLYSGMPSGAWNLEVH